MRTPLVAALLATASLCAIAQTPATHAAPPTTATLTFNSAHPSCIVPNPKVAPGNYKITMNFPDGSSISGKQAFVRMDSITEAISIFALYKQANNDPCPTTIALAPAK